MIHIRIDDSELNADAVMACGISLADLRSAGDKYFWSSESAADRLADCPKCNPHRRQLGTPISQLSGRPGHPGYEEFCRISNSWGYP